ncbi:hypothetical protein GALMADRAFT_369582 [Galerina marginata CBS 339.88]|uniref:Uncharacterized protein n=1 Tax=Galerina marginata (strain CBS 339.88) TaxID=685588 RepID=A0A067TQT0_GALM3|nr:hypothetical protein GALMADRAFT_369582 [Galerina marginata CBS 339.88]
MPPSRQGLIVALPPLPASPCPRCRSPPRIETSSSSAVYLHDDNEQDASTAPGSVDAEAEQCSLSSLTHCLPST